MAADGRLSPSHVQIVDVGAPPPEPVPVKVNRCFFEDYLMPPAILAAGAGTGFGFKAGLAWVGGGFGAALVVMSVAYARLRCVRPQRVLADQITRLEREKGELNGTVAELRDELQTLTRVKEEVEKTARELQGKQDQQISELESVQKNLDSAVAKFQAVKALYEAYKKKTESFLTQLKAVREGQQAVSEELTDLELGNELGEFQREAEGFQQRLQEFQTEIVNIANMQKTLESLKQEVQAIKAAADENRETAGRVEATADQLSRILADITKLEGGDESSA